jgi:hypothetical protein
MVCQELGSPVLAQHVLLLLLALDHLGISGSDKSKNVMSKLGKLVVALDLECFATVEIALVVYHKLLCRLNPYFFLCQYTTLKAIFNPSSGE